SNASPPPMRTNWMRWRAARPPSRAPTSYSRGHKCDKGAPQLRAAILVDQVHGQRQGHTRQRDVVARPVGRGTPGPRIVASPHRDLPPSERDEHVRAAGGDGPGPRDLVAAVLAPG